MKPNHYCYYWNTCIRKSYRLEGEQCINIECRGNSVTENQKVISNSVVEYNDPKEGRLSRCQTPPSRRDSNATIQSNTSSASKIPRYIRNTAICNTSNSNSNVASTVSSPVQRKLLTKQQGQKYVKRGQETSERNGPTNSFIEGKFFSCSTNLYF